MGALSEQQVRLLKDWIPTLACGLIAWLAFVWLGDTPLVRASGLALVIVGVAATVRRLGAVLALTGGLALAFSPAFWSQTGGGQGEPATIVIAIVVAALATGGIALAVRRPNAALAAGILVFAAIFWSQVGTPRSLRLTSLVTAWLMYLIIDTLLRTNPRPDDPPRERPEPRYTLGVLLLFTVGVLNDPVLTVFAPAISIALFLSNFKLPRWYWGALMLVVGIGIRGIVAAYFDPNHTQIMLSLWRNSDRWLELFGLIVNQFSIWGVILSALGLARLARWYPPVGTVTMIAFGAYVLFGLVYFGGDRQTLLLPLLIIQVTWMTYAVYTFGQWMRKSFHGGGRVINWFAPAIYALLPLLLFVQLFNKP